MKRFLPALVITWSFVVAPDSALAESPALVSAYLQFEGVTVQGRLAEAVPFARKAMVLGKEEFGPDHIKYAKLVYNLAALYKRLDRYGEAAPLYKQNLAIREKVLGSDHSEAAKLRNELALVYQSPGPLQRSGAALQPRPGDRREDWQTWRCSDNAEQSSRIVLEATPL